MKASGEKGRREKIFLLQKKKILKKIDVSPVDQKPENHVQKCFPIKWAIMLFIKFIWPSFYGEPSAPSTQVRSLQGQKSICHYSESLQDASEVEGSHPTKGFLGTGRS